MHTALLKNFPLTALIGLVLANGCAGTQSLVERRFAALHGCPAETVMAVNGGWVATGCGVRAHFMCFDTDDDDHYDEDETIAGHIVSSMLFSGLGDDDVCIQEQVDRVAERMQPPRDPTEVSKAKDGSVRLRMHVPLSAPDGLLVVTGAPEWRDPSVAVRMTLEGEEPLAEPCAAQLWIEGAASHLPALRNSDSTISMALTADQLAQLAESEHVSFEACGRVVPLDAGARARLRLYASRYADARARLLPAAEAARAAK